MYQRTDIDRNIKKQRWFKKMIPEHRLLLKDLILYELDNIGLCAPDLDDFYTENEGLIQPNTIDLQLFVDDCNNDGKERMHILDRGRVLWFSSTIIFRNSDMKTGFRWMANNQRDASILRNLSARSEMRHWLIDQVVYNDRLNISTDLITTVHNAEKATEQHKEFMQDLAKKLSFKIPAGKNSPDAIKERYGCICQYCQEPFSKDNLQIDHVLPQSHPKSNDAFWNKVPACRNCNNEKGEKNVFAFLKEKEFELSKGVENAVDKWVKRGVLEYPTQYGDKRNKKEKSWTYQQVVDFISKNPGETFDNYICINPESSKQDKRWKRL